MATSTAAFLRRTPFMAATDSSTFPIKAQAFRLYFVVLSTATGNPLTGGLTGLGTVGNRQASKDGASFANLTNAPVEIGTSGYGYVDLTSTEMNANSVIVRILASNTNAQEFATTLYPMDLTEPTGRADAATVKRLETYVVQTVAYLFNQNVVSGNIQTLYKADSTTAMVTGSQSQTDTSASRSKLS